MNNFFFVIVFYSSYLFNDARVSIVIRNKKGYNVRGKCLHLGIGPKIVIRDEGVSGEIIDCRRKTLLNTIVYLISSKHFLSVRRRASINSPVNERPKMVSS